MSTLTLRFPEKSSVSNDTTLSCHYVLSDKKQMQEGTATLPELASEIANASQTVLLLAPSDVTVLKLKTPPLSATKLKAALPALVEDSLLCDPADCVIVSGDEQNGLRLIAITDQAWLTLLVTTLKQLGARRIRALPSLSCLPSQADTISAVIETHDNGMALGISTNVQDMLGMQLPSDTNANDMVATLRALQPEAAITLYVPDALSDAYKQAADERMTVENTAWANWMTNYPVAPDLCAGLETSTNALFEWKRWRWAVMLAAAIGIANIAGLQMDWWRLKSEAQGLRTAMTQTFRTAYPKESVIVDPLAQMQQKINQIRSLLGQPASDDFLALVASLGQAWTSLGHAHKLPAIAKLEYSNRSLLVKWKAETPVNIETLRPALAAHNLSAQQTEDGWQIRSVK